MVNIQSKKNQAVRHFDWSEENTFTHVHRAFQYLAVVSHLSSHYYFLSLFAFSFFTEPIWFTAFRLRQSDPRFFSTAGCRSLPRSPSGRPSRKPKEKKERKHVILVRRRWVFFWPSTHIYFVCSLDMSVRTSSTQPVHQAGFSLMRAKAECFRVFLYKPCGCLFSSSFW